MPARASWPRFGLVAVVVAACATNGTPNGRMTPADSLAAGDETAVSVTTTPGAARQPCQGSFVAHPLGVMTNVREEIRMFDSNGSGVAIGDLDDDGDPDLVFADLDGPDSILWNEGGLRFTRTELNDTSSRAVNIVDVDGDGTLDIVFTHRAGGVSMWRRASPDDPRRYENGTLPGVSHRAYSMAWADLDGDGRLDLVTGSYDAESFLELRDTFLSSDGDGVYAYLQGTNGFAAERLARTAQALSIALPDLDLDGRRDILVGNDFLTPDAAWRRVDGGFEAIAEPFDTTTEDTMSLAEGDIDNDGVLELFATDMKPYALDIHTTASWLPVMDKMPKQKPPSDPQIIANVLQVRDGDGVYRDRAMDRGISATGWSWSSKFGDLDNDGFLDLYVVNGMIDAQNLGHLQGHQLVEQNRAFRNLHDGTFDPVPEWSLGATESGRGMSMADMDGDGDLDIIVNNLAAEARLFENRVCGGHAMQVDLRWDGHPNSRAIGTRLALVTDRGTFRRDVTSGSGYLSGDAVRQHFGIPLGAKIARLEVLWPDGQRSTVDAPSADVRLMITRNPS